MSQTYADTLRASQARFIMAFDEHEKVKKIGIAAIQRFAKVYCAAKTKVSTKNWDYRRVDGWTISDKHLRITFARNVLGGCEDLYSYMKFPPDTLEIAVHGSDAELRAAVAAIIEAERLDIERRMATKAEQEARRAADAAAELERQEREQLAALKQKYGEN